MFTANLYINDAPWKEISEKMFAPCVVIRAGKLCGSGGCIFYREDVLKQSLNHWEGVPVTINHPKINGNFVSVRESPDAIIGYLSHVEWKDGIKAMVNITNNDFEIRAMARRTKEVSSGLHIHDEIVNRGEFDDDIYACALVIEPDHLALLPDDIGACSFRDGCGIRNNKKGEEKMSEKKLTYDEWIALFTKKTINNQLYEPEPLLAPDLTPVLTNSYQEVNQKNNNEVENEVEPEPLLAPEIKF